MLMADVILLICPQSGVLDKYNVELIGAKLPSIDRAEDRELFKQAMQRIGLKVREHMDC
jgi:carbamoylphosphate synthase large subunit